MTEPMGTPAKEPFLQSLGPRSQRRAEPRTSIALAGAGCALAVLGVLIVSGDTGASGDGFNQWPGAVFCAAVVVAGYVTMDRVRTGSVATGGAVAAFLGVPPLVFFLSFDKDGFPPYSTEAILVVSTLAWLASYCIGPGKGRPLFLGAGLIGLWFSLMQLTEEVFDLPYGLFGFLALFGTFEVSEGSSMGSGLGDDSFESLPGPFGGSSFDFPDLTTLGLISLGLGILYLVACRRLDRSGHHGTATPFAFATIPTVTAGALLLGDDLEQAGMGLLLVAVGLALATHGSGVWRRGTTWVGGLLTSVGAAVFLIDMTDDATIGGLLFLAAGIAIVFAGHAWANARDEPDEMEVTTLAAAVADQSQWSPPPDEPPAPPPPPAD